MRTYDKDYAHKRVEDYLGNIPPDYREANLIFLYYSTFPGVFNPDILYQLWLNFRNYEKEGKIESMPIVVVSDLLQLGLCEEVAFELYELEEQVIHYLRENIGVRLEEKGCKLLFSTKDIAKLTLGYARQFLQGPHQRNLYDTYYWKSVFIINPDEAINSIKVIIKKNSTNNLSNISNHTARIFLELADLQLLAMGTEQDYKKVPVFSFQKEDEESYEITDRELVGLIAQKLGLSTKDKYDTAKERIRKCKETRSKSLNLGYCGLKNFKVIQELFECVWLEELVLSNIFWEYDVEDEGYKDIVAKKDELENQFAELPNELSQLKNLKKFVCGGWDDKDWELGNLEVLATLKEITALNLANNQISDISFLKEMNGLVHLKLSKNKIEDITILKSLIHLESLELNNNQIQDISALRTLVGLKELTLSNNQIKDISSLEKLNKLTFLDLHSNKIKDLYPLISLLMTGLPLILDKWKKNAINVLNNPFTSPPIEIIEQGNKAVVKFFKKIIEIPLTTSKAHLASRKKGHKVYLFCLGGTGARVMHALTMWMATDITINCEAIVPMFIDLDERNGDKTRAKIQMELYQKIYNHLESNPSPYFSIPLMKLGSIKKGDGTKYESINEDYDLPFINSDQTYYNFLKLNKLDALDKDFLYSLFNDSDDNQAELKLNMNMGFQGNPNLGSIVFHSLKTNKTFLYFENQFNENDKIVIISSLFGGTGASGFPQLVRTLRESNLAAISNADISAICLMPYFKVEEVYDSRINSDLFLSKTKATLSYYQEDIVKSVNRFYFLADDVSKQLRNRAGGSAQINPAHLIEMIAATGVIHAINLVGNTNKYYEFGVKDLPIGSDIGLKDFYTDELSDSDTKWWKMARFGFFAKFVLYGMNDRTQETFYRILKIADRSKIKYEFYENLKYFLREYWSWLKQMHETERRLRLFRLDHNDPFSIFLYDKESIKGLDKSSGLLGIGANDYFSTKFNEEINKMKRDNNINDEQKFMRGAVRVFERAFKEKIISLPKRE